MKQPTGATRYYEDRLVRRWQVANGFISHGKRVSRNCPLSRDEIRQYVRYGAVQCIKLMRQQTRPMLDLRGCKDLLDTARWGKPEREIEAWPRPYFWKNIKEKQS